jgi:hypothetical protein
MDEIVKVIRCDMQSLNCVSKYDVRITYIVMYTNNILFYLRNIYGDKGMILFNGN